MPNIMDLVDGWEAKTADRHYDINDKSPVEYEISEAVYIHSDPELLAPSIPPVEVSRPDDPNAIVPLCGCSEKPHAHRRHRDHSGPGSGKALDPFDQRQAHRQHQEARWEAQRPSDRNPGISSFTGLPYPRQYAEYKPAGESNESRREFHEASGEAL